MSENAMNFEKMDLDKLPDNVFSLIGKEWLLVTAGTPDNYNMMTASWGTMGILWGKPVCIIFIRPTRYTYEFIERNDTFSLNILPEKLRKILDTCGSKSGRDFKKMEMKGLTKCIEQDTVCFAESRLVFLCRKIYFQDLQPEHFLTKDIAKNYPKKDYHRFYVGEIIGCLKNKAIT
jgi:flavin reductase (DIM6/NTAB) family NADH-FMN oxidoreductase RutF